MSLRDRQRELTRRAIVDGVLELVAEGDLDQLSIPDVSRRSGVSVATIYRYFPTKRDLLAAAAWAPSSHAEELRPERLTGDGLRDYLVALWTAFAENLPLVRHQVASTTGREMRTTRMEGGRAQLAAELAELGIDPVSTEGRRLVSLCLLLGSSLTLLELHDRQGLGVEDAADEVTWAAAALLEATQRETRLAGRTKRGSARR